MIDIIRCAIDGVVTGHQGLRLGLNDGIAKMRQPILAQHALTDCGIERRSPVLDIVDGIVLQGRSHF